jgi:hypothetical protein
MVGDYDLEPVRSVYDYPFEALLQVLNVNEVVEQELVSVGRDFYQIVVPRLMALGTSDLTLHRYFSLMVQRAGWLPVSVYIILVVPSSAFVALIQIRAVLEDTLL